MCVGGGEVGLLDSQDWKDSRMGAVATSSGRLFQTTMNSRIVPVISVTVGHRAGSRTRSMFMPNAQCL